MSSYRTIYRLRTWTIAMCFVALGCFAQQPVQDSLQLIETYRTEAHEALKRQAFSDAIVSLNKANQLVSSSDNLQLKASIQLDVAELHFSLQNYMRSATEAQKALKLAEQAKNDTLKANVYALNGMVLSRLQRFEEAETNFKRADLIYLNNGNEVQQAKVLLGLGLLQLIMNKKKDAVNYFNAAIPVLQDNEMQYELASAYLYKSEALLGLGEGIAQNYVEESATTLARARDLITRYGFHQLEINSYKIASYIALRRNDYEAAEQNLELYESKSDSVQQVYLQAISKGVEFDTNINNLKEVIATQKDDLSKQRKSINFGKMTTGLSIALIVILSLLTLSLYKNNNLRAKANELLQDKNNELQLAKEKAEKASLAKAQFLSTITHELRTPLYAVTGLTHLLLEEDPKPHQKEHLNSLKFSGEYLLSLINNILDLNKLEANKVEIEKASFSLKKRINDVLIALKKSADDRKNNLHLEFDESIPDRLVGDPLKLSQILINLIGNSVKFTQNGDVVVRVSNLGESNGKVNLHFEIEDNGVGISKKKQKSIFETFSQASLQINRKFGGTGLGLSIVKNLLELMGSKINLESQLGKGSKFWFNINFEISQEVMEEKNPKNIIYDVDYVALENRKILVVEDNKINQMITRKILEKNKMVCMVADNGMDAIKLVKENQFDVILMDIHMPGISGIEATQKIRAFNKELPIIALTAVTIDENLDDFYRAGFNEIIPKPFKPEEFFEKIYRTIEGKTTAVGN